MNVLSEETVVYVGALDFSDNPQRPQHIASRLAVQNKVLYLESPFSLVGLLGNGFRELTKLSRHRAGVRSVSPSMALLTPPPSLYPLDKWSPVSWFYAKWVGWCVRKALKKLSWGSDPIVYSTRPWGAWLASSIHAKLLVLDWYAPWVEHWAHLILRRRIWTPVVWFNNRLKRGLARRALALADMLFCGARIYAAQAKEWGFESTLLPNGAEMDMWRKRTDDMDARTPAEIESIRSPRLGVIAARIHKDIVDIELIRQVADRRPHWSWILIGSIMGDLGDLCELPNVHALGHKPYELLPQYVAGFDVCCIPYRLNSTTQSGLPVKLLEYLPSGKPIITYPSSEIVADANLSPLVSFASTPDEFILAAEALLEGELPSRVDARRHVATYYDWNMLACMVEERISCALSSSVHEHGGVPTCRGKAGR